MYSKNVLLEKLQLAALDAAVVFVSLMVATWLRHGLGLLAPGGEPSEGAVPWSAYLLPALLVALVVVVLFRFEGLYALTISRFGEAFSVVKSVSIATMASLTLTFFYRGYSYSRATVLIFYPLAILALAASRGLYRAYRRAVLSNPEAARRVLIVGFGRVGQHLGRALLESPAYYDLVGFLDDDPRKGGGQVQHVPVLGTTLELVRWVRERDVHEVFLAIPSAPQERVMDLVGECIRLKVRWKVVPNLCDLMLERVHLDHVGGLPLIGVRGSRIVGFNWMIKRAFDLAVSTSVLLLLSPVYLAIALAIKLSSRGPVIYRQRRVGLHGKSFDFLKFRTMRFQNDAAIHERYTADWIYGRTGDGQAPRSVGAAAAEPPPAARVSRGLHKITRDPRVTRVGRFLRRTSLDELPQFWNVVRGEMSVVGPRPPIPYEVERYTEWHKRRLEVLPGITGLWQVSGRNKLSFEEMVRLDIEYIESWSLEQDVKIALRTVPALLFGRAF